MNATVNWGKDQQYGITTRGWIVRMNDAGKWTVFDDADRYVGAYATRDEAVEVAR
jgi:hypothetical protein